MPNIGTYAAPAPEPETDDPVTITVADEVFRLRARPPGIVFYEFSRLAHEGVTYNSPAGRSGVLAFFEGVLAPGEYPRFMQHCRRVGISGDVLIDVVGDVFEWWGQRPTASSSDSSTSPGGDSASTGGDDSEPPSSPEPLPVRHVSLATPKAS